jgi:hypothetical protein
MRKRVITILADGMRDDLLSEELAKGNLPDISRYFVESGTKLSAVTSFPSTTGPAYLPFLTGCLPGTCNVPGIRWFDKEKYNAGFSMHRYRSYVGLESFYMTSDISPHIKTMFELVPKSYSIFNPIARGAGNRNETRISRIWYWYYAHLTDRWQFVDAAASQKLRAVLEKDPRYVFAVFPAIDEYSHFTHPAHERVLSQYRAFDAHVGAIVDAVSRKGWLEETAFFIVSDHGLSKTDRHFCVNEFLEKRGLPAFFYPKIFDKQGKLSANMVSGNGMTHLYFKKSEGWAGRTSIEELDKISPSIIDDLLAEEAIDLVAARGNENSIHVFSRKGSAKINLDGERLRYEPIGGDPFGYKALPVEMSPEFSLARTFDSDYPDAPFQIVHLMTSLRAGDVVLSATPGYDLRLGYEHPEHFGSHGSLHKSHMRVPVLTNLKLKDTPIRTVDVFPTQLQILGCDLPDYIDGKPISARIST